jgi:S-disulfanyl-L-cysteine oxidoreductase SoxD
MKIAGTLRRALRRRGAVMCVALMPLACSTAPAQDRPWSTIGRPATAAEVRAWDIDVGGGFQGLPPGDGSVAQGQAIWEAKCASCHGVFGESNDVFTPIVGGTTRQDIETGRVRSLAIGGAPHRTTMMKLSRLSSLWDYIRRAMPWNAPKSLTTNEVYAVTAYILSLADVVPQDFTLSDRNIRQVQMRLPNRDGMVLHRDMWVTSGRGDVKNTLCMKDCAGEIQLLSAFPDAERNNHGNLAEQNRQVGPVRGIDTTLPPRTTKVGGDHAAPPSRDVATPTK